MPKYPRFYFVPCEIGEGIFVAFTSPDTSFQRNNDLDKWNKSSLSNEARHTADNFMQRCTKREATANGKYQI